MATQGTVKWSIEADYFQGCSCDYGCPCEFEAPPTQGFCEGVLAWRINRGSYGRVSLNGLGLAAVIHFPGPLHEGNGTAAIFVDQRANQQQRDAILTIASGQAGGLPFEIIAKILSKVLEPQFVPLHFEVKGKDSGVRIGTTASVAFQSIKNPVTGEPEGVRVVHDSGFIFKEADVVATKECLSSVAEMTFSWPNKAGFVTQVKYGN